MKYKITQAQVITDNELLKGWSLSRLKKILGHNIGYISKVRSGKVIISERKYLEIRGKVAGNPTP